MQQEQRINWYPGHMAKTLRLLAEQVRRCDLIIEICDARLPLSSRNPEMNKIGGSKPRLLILNKSDLADPERTREWITFYQNEFTEVRAINAQKTNGKMLVSLIGKQTRQIIDQYERKGIRKTVRAMVVGVPNVGKSTLINRVCGEKKAVTGDRPGVTRSNQWVRISPYLELLDTPGMLWPKLDDQAAARRLCYIGIIKDDVVDLYDLTMSLLEEMIQINPKEVRDRCHLQEDEMHHGAALLDDVCKGRGWLLKGGVSDYDRCCRVVLDEFRSGLMGSVTFEKPVTANRETGGEP